MVERGMDTGERRADVAAKITNDGKTKREEALRVTVRIEKDGVHLARKSHGDAVDHPPSTDGFQRLVAPHARGLSARHDDGADPHACE